MLDRSRGITKSFPVMGQRAMHTVLPGRLAIYCEIQSPAVV
jgi:hypothetical protein